jgi:hypothetical protein
MSNGSQVIDVGMHGYVRLLAWGMAVVFFLVSALVFYTASVDETSLGIPWRFMTFLVFIFLVFLAYHWRLRCDDIGIHRRRFLRWTTWRWEEFASGAVHLSDRYNAFVFPKRPFLERRFSFCPFAGKGIDEIVGHCFRAWKESPQDPAPEEVVFNVRDRPLRPMVEVRCSRQGVTLTRGKQQETFAWIDVGRIDLDRYRGQQIGFLRCRILAGPNELIMTASERGRGSWDGPDPRTIAAVFERNACERTVYVYRGEPESVSELDVLIERLRDRYLDARRSRLPLVAFFTLGSFGLLFYGVWVCGQPPSDMGVSGVAFMGGLGVLTAFVLPHQIKKQLEVLERRRQELLNSSKEASGRESDTMAGEK